MTELDSDEEVATSAAYAEERQFPRYPVSAYVERNYHGGTVRLRVQNISLGGICLQSDFPEEVGTHLELALFIPEHKEPFVVRGEVVWVNRSHPKDMGVRFLQVEKHALQELEVYIRTISRHVEKEALWAENHQLLQ